jgi:hypothetical protein
MYVCWYSELRELLFRKPDLSNKLKVFALPGKGFKGDWHIGILNGSVSANLGLNVVKKLCNKNEDFKRFTFGVGLPSKSRFIEKEENKIYGKVSEVTKFKKAEVFYAWPNSSITLDKVYKIHHFANERAKITGYLEFKEQFVALFHWLIMMEFDLENKIKVKNKKIEKINNEEDREIKIKDVIKLSKKYHQRTIRKIILNRINDLYTYLGKIDGKI